MLAALLPEFSLVVLSFPALLFPPHPASEPTSRTAASDNARCFAFLIPLYPFQRFLLQDLVYSREFVFLRRQTSDLWWK
ncbi:hypothetical protein D3C74_441590 [compost metagenome]